MTRMPVSARAKARAKTCRGSRLKICHSTGTRARAPTPHISMASSSFPISLLPWYNLFIPAKPFVRVPSLLGFRHFRRACSVDVRRLYKAFADSSGLTADVIAPSAEPQRPAKPLRCALPRHPRAVHRAVHQHALAHVLLRALRRLGYQRVLADARLVAHCFWALKFGTIKRGSLQLGKSRLPARTVYPHDEIRVLRQKRAVAS